MTAPISQSSADSIMHAFQDRKFHQAYRREDGETWSLEFSMKDGNDSDPARAAEFRTKLLDDLNAAVVGAEDPAAAIDEFVNARFLVRYDGMFSRDPNEAEQREQLTGLAEALKGAYGVQPK